MNLRTQPGAGLPAGIAQPASRDQHRFLEPSRKPHSPQTAQAQLLFRFGSSAWTCLRPVTRPAAATAGSPTWSRPRPTAGPAPRLWFQPAPGPAPPPLVSARRWPRPSASGFGPPLAPPLARSPPLATGLPRILALAAPRPRRPPGTASSAHASCPSALPGAGTYCVHAARISVLTFLQPGCPRHDHCGHWYLCRGPGRMCVEKTQGQMLVPPPLPRLVSRGKLLNLSEPGLSPLCGEPPTWPRWVAARIKGDAVQCWAGGDGFPCGQSDVEYLGPRWYLPLMVSFLSFHLSSPQPRSLLFLSFLFWGFQGVFSLFVCLCICSSLAFLALSCHTPGKGG